MYILTGSDDFIIIIIIIDVIIMFRLVKLQKIHFPPAYLIISSDKVHTSC